MSTDPERKIWIEQNLDAYQITFDPEWAQYIDRIVAEVPHLDQLVFDLGMAWRAAAYTVAMPKILVESVHGFFASYVKTNSSVTESTRRFMLGRAYRH